MMTPVYTFLLFTSVPCLTAPSLRGYHTQPSQVPLESYPNHLTEEKCHKIHAIYNDAVQVNVIDVRLPLADCTVLQTVQYKACFDLIHQRTNSVPPHHMPTNYPAPKRI